MGDKADKNDLLFEVMTPLGFRVRINRSYWKFIVTVKHPVMAKRESDVKEVLEKPNEIRLSRSDKKVHLFYSLESKGRWVCVITKRLNGEGFLITTYLTDAIKEGARIWPK